MHTIERDEEKGNVFQEGIAGWKMVLNTFKKKKPEQQQEQGDGFSASNSNS